MILGVVEFEIISAVPLVHRRERRSTTSWGTRTLAKRNKAIHRDIRWGVDRGLRYQIACLRDHGLSQGIEPNSSGFIHRLSVIELRRNCAGAGYQPLELTNCHGFATADESEAYCPSDTIDFCFAWALVADWSPEQISGVGDMINCPVSHEVDIPLCVLLTSQRWHAIPASASGSQTAYRKGRTANAVSFNPVSIDERLR